MGWMIWYCFVYPIYQQLKYGIDLQLLIRYSELCRAQSLVTMQVIQNAAFHLLPDVDFCSIDEQHYTGTWDIVFVLVM